MEAVEEEDKDIHSQFDSSSSSEKSQESSDVSSHSSVSSGDGNNAETAYGVDAMPADDNFGDLPMRRQSRDDSELMAIRDSLAINQ